jgi:hypothetical protein
MTPSLRTLLLAFSILSVPFATLACSEEADGLTPVCADPGGPAGAGGTEAFRVGSPDCFTQPIAAGGSTTGTSGSGGGAGEASAGAAGSEAGGAAGSETAGAAGAAGNEAGGAAGASGGSAGASAAGASGAGGA